MASCAIKKLLLCFPALLIVALWFDAPLKFDDLHAVSSSAGETPTQLGSGARRLKGDHFVRPHKQPHAGWAREGSLTYNCVFGVQLLVLAVQVGTLLKDNGCSKALLSLDLLGCIMTAIGLFILGDVASGAFLGDNLHVFESRNVSVVATTPTTAGQHDCFQFSNAEIVEKCVSAAQAFKDRCFGAPKSLAAAASRLSDDSCLQTNALGSCAMFATRLCAHHDSECVEKLIKEMRSSNPAVTFMNTLFSSKLALIAYIVGNTARLLFLGISLLGVLPTMPKPVEWGLSVIQDGLCAAAMLLVSQMSFDNDCLEITFMGDLHSFLAFSNYALYFLFYGWSCLVGVLLLAYCCPDIASGGSKCQLFGLIILSVLVLVVDGCAAWIYSIVIGIYDAASSGETEALISTAFMVIGVLSGIYPLIRNASAQASGDAAGAKDYLELSTEKTGD